MFILIYLQLRAETQEKQEEEDEEGGVQEEECNLADEEVLIWISSKMKLPCTIIILFMPEKTTKCPL